MLVFGSEPFFSGLPNDLWSLSLDGTLTWSEIVPEGTAPPGRGDFSMIYDPAGDRVFLYGGRSGGTIRSDLWELSLSATPTWTEITTAGVGPGSREDHVAALDPIRDRMILFGGIGTGGTWALELSPDPVWVELAPGGTAPPSDLWRSRMIYDPDGDRMLLIGGYAIGVNGVSRNTVWELTLEVSPEWRELAPVGHVSRGFNNHTAALREASGEILVYSGNGNTASVYRLATSSDAPVPVAVSQANHLRCLPNPASSQTWIEFELARDADVHVEAFDAAGRKAADLFHSQLGAGRHRLPWKLTDEAVAEGIYYVRMRAGDDVRTGRVTIIR